MIHTLITAHIILLSVSILLTIGTTIAAANKNSVSKRLTACNIVITSFGVLLGIILLLDAPIGSRCIELSAYVALFAVAQVYIRKRNNQLTAQAV